jgi:hypothetical protein
VQATHDHHPNQLDSTHRHWLAGAPVIWDPFLHGNVKAGQKVELEVCLVDGWDDLSGSRCGDASRRSADG